MLERVGVSVLLVCTFSFVSLGTQQEGMYR